MIEFLKSLIRKILSDNRGLTLIEVIVSSVILVTISVGLISTLSYSKSMGLIAQEKMVAVNLIEERINYLKGEGISTLVNSTIPCIELPTPPLPCWGSYDKNAGVYLTGGNVYVCVSQPDPPNDPKYRDVTVKVTWTDRLGRQKTESATVVLYEP